MRLRDALTILLCAMLATLSAACGGGSGGGGGEAAPAPSFAGSFTPDTDTPGSQTVSMAQASTSGDLVTLEVNITDTVDVYGASFTVAFDPGAAQFIRRAPGSVLESGGEIVLYQHSVPQPGRLEVGVARIEDNPGADVSGTGALVTLTFRVTSAGTSTVSFENADLLNSQPPQPQPIPGLSWSGGTLVAN